MTREKPLANVMEVVPGTYLTWSQAKHTVRKKLHTGGEGESQYLRRLPGDFDAKLSKKKKKKMSVVEYVARTHDLRITQRGCNAAGVKLLCRGLTAASLILFFGVGLASFVLNCL